jgi:prepilin-type N-terminal cleavage/methylation domain-containing protein
MDGRNVPVSRVRREDGFTLIEMLVACAIALVVLTAALTMLVSAMARTTETAGRVASTERGRIALDTMTRQIRSQACLGNADTSFVSSDQITNFPTSGTQASFYVDFSDQSQTVSAAPPELHRLRYDAPSRQLIEDDYAMISDGAAAPTFTWRAPASPTRSRVLAQDVVQDGSTPIFQYYKYVAGTPATLQLIAPADPVSAADAALIARVDIDFKVLRPGMTSVSSSGSTVFDSQVTIRSVDPNDDLPSPQC